MTHCDARHLALFCLAAAACEPELPLLPQCPGEQGDFRVPLSSGWRVQSSASVHTADREVSGPGYATDGWHAATVPSTVVRALVEESGIDPYMGMNLRSLPGVTYPVGSGFGDIPIPDDSPFVVPWWFRGQFELPRAPGDRHVWLRLAGVSYRADVWLNGRLVADKSKVAGTFRNFELDVSAQVTACAANTLALKVFSQKQDELGWNWVDWNPFPPDKNMGVWGEVEIFTSGPVRLRHPQVESKLSADRAHLTVRVEASNVSDRSVSFDLDGALEARRFNQKVTLAPGETRELEFPLDVDQPRLWWPVHMGAPELYTVELHATVDGLRSDDTETRFGIREITSELDALNHRLFKVNGRPVLIRGAGWTPEMLMRWPSRRIEDEVRYVRDMNLNAIRLEGKLGLDRLVELCDENGILVIAGWCCCDHWEHWQDWDAEDYQIGMDSLRDQIKKLRGHPSLLVWLNGSDNAPPPDVEAEEVKILGQLHWPNPHLASANSTVTDVDGVSGVKMPGPYMWVPPVYWEYSTDRGGAAGFNTETSCGAAIPPLESLRKFIPADHLWPLDDAWIFHSGSANFVSLDVYTAALDSRYGPSSSVEDFAAKSQLSAYEGVRAMFEAYGRGKYLATGVIQWMLNNAWPGIIWHLYDFYLKPGGGYFGAKKANEPIHVQYSYSEHSVWVVASDQMTRTGLTARALVLDLDGNEVLRRQNDAIDLAADGTLRVLSLAGAVLPPVHFIDLSLQDSSGAELSRNFYWASTRPDVLDDASAEWFYTPTSQTMDMRALSSMSMVPLEASFTRRSDGDDEVLTVTLHNPGTKLAFFVRVEAATTDTGDELLPVRWSDNYISLRGGETRTLTARYRNIDLGQKAVVRMEGWNVPRTLASP